MTLSIFRRSKLATTKIDFSPENAQRPFNYFIPSYNPYGSARSHRHSNIRTLAPAQQREEGIIIRERRQLNTVVLGEQTHIRTPDDANIMNYYILQASDISSL